jgi:hypothetical protein
MATLPDIPGQSCIGQRLVQSLGTQSLMIDCYRGSLAGIATHTGYFNLL